MSQRLNITLPEETIELVDRAAPRGRRSRWIDEAVRFFIRHKGKARLRNQLERGAKARSERDLHVATEWFAVPD